VTSYGVGRSWVDEFRLRLLRRAPLRPTGRGFVSGAAMLVPRAEFLALGGFDERFFMYYEDIDFGLRWSATGWPVVVEDGFLAFHEGGHSAKQEPSVVSQLRSHESAIAFHEKWSGSSLAYELLVLFEQALRVVHAWLAGRSGQLSRATTMKLLLLYGRRLVSRLRPARRDPSAAAVVGK
jgi:GT2 family glycosyltransferase